MMNNFDDILLELGYRVPEGIVDLTKEHQVTELVNILKENGYANANELAQKARVYFSYLAEIEEAGRKKSTGPETLVVNKKSGAVYPVKNFNPNTQTKASKRDIEKAKATGKFGTQKPVGKQKTAPAADIRVSDAEKKKQQTQTSKSKVQKEYQPTPTQIQTFKGRKKVLLEVVEKGFLGSEEKITKGVGVFEPTDEELKAIIDVTKKQLKNPNYRLKLPKYDISEEDIDIAVGIVKNKLGPEGYKKWEQRVTKAGAVDNFLTSGEAGRKRFRAIVRKYLETGGRSAITGKFVPFNQMQLDHHVPFSSAKEALADKKRRGIKTTIEDEKRRLDSAPNWDLMETRINQHKNSLEGNELLEKSLKKYNRSPEEKELKKIQDEIKSAARQQLFTNLIKSFGKGDYSGFTEESIAQLNMEDQQMVAKAWNYWHPNIKENDTKNFLAADPNYPKILKKAGIDINQPNPHFIVRYKAQVGGSRTRSLPKKPELMRKDMTDTMKRAKVLMSKKESLKTDTALAKAILERQKNQKKLKDREKELKAKIKQQQSKK